MASTRMSSERLAGLTTNPLGMARSRTLEPAPGSGPAQPAPDPGRRRDPRVPPRATRATSTHADRQIRPPPYDARPPLDVSTPAAARLSLINASTKNDTTANEERGTWHYGSRTFTPRMPDEHMHHSPCDMWDASLPDLSISSIPGRNTGAGRTRSTTKEAYTSTRRDSGAPPPAPPPRSPSAALSP